MLMPSVSLFLVLYSYVHKVYVLSVNPTPALSHSPPSPPTITHHTKTRPTTTLFLGFISTIMIGFISMWSDNVSGVYSGSE